MMLVEYCKSYFYQIAVFSDTTQLLCKRSPIFTQNYLKNIERLWKQALQQLLKKGYEFICGNYSIADVATYPWVAIYEFLGLTLDNYPNLKRWVEIVQQRPAVQRGMQVP
ncbi:glutathione binding-like protein [Nostoc sp. DedSLP04]|uniref:glutathione binding-like protein n=1 Tax=Nostoc sp. DedSLP04 TaxID=3075401 RepID=UPI002AD459BD|nr:glutathione binding-like protein [Nostoc sp. DedSLP04]MDZ8036006.1 glutathione binding-like protein [Nostoc sp. DedSLP04]